MSVVWSKTKMYFSVYERFNRNAYGLESIHQLQILKASFQHLTKLIDRKNPINSDPEDTEDVEG